MSVFEEIENGVREAFPGCKVEVRAASFETEPPYHVALFRNGKVLGHVHSSEPHIPHLVEELRKQVK